MQLRPRAGHVLALALAGALSIAGGPGVRADEEVRLAADTLVYTDDDGVQIVTPQASARLVDEEEGIEAGARVALDVITAASVDVTSHATRRFSEERFDADVDLARTIGDHRTTLAYHLSWEPDYVSQGLTAGVDSELAGPDAVLALRWSTLWDLIGRAQTPRTSFSEQLVSHSGTVSLTQAIDPLTVVRATAAVSVRSGYLEKPYRFVPMFDEGGGARAARPPEEVPETRLGLAAGVRALRWVEGLGGSLRLDAQVYRDTWSMTSVAVEPAIVLRAGERLRLSGHVRFYWQDAVYFWRRTYVVPEGVLPRWRSLDRDLSPFWTLSGGVRAELEVGDDVALYAEPGVMYTRYLDFLLLEDRIALTALVGVRCVP